MRGKVGDFGRGRRRRSPGTSHTPIVRPWSPEGPDRYRSSTGFVLLNSQKHDATTGARGSPSPRMLSDGMLTVPCLQHDDLCTRRTAGVHAVMEVGGHVRSANSALSCLAAEQPRTVPFVFSVVQELALPSDGHMHDASSEFGGRTSGRRHLRIQTQAIGWYAQRGPVQSWRYMCNADARVVPLSCRSRLRRQTRTRAAFDLEIGVLVKSYQRNSCGWGFCPGNASVRLLWVQYEKVRLRPSPSRCSVCLSAYSDLLFPGCDFADHL